MISLFTIGSPRSSNPWVVPHPTEVEFYGESMPLIEVDIVYLKIPLVLADIYQ
jgi:hypothetical protein